MCSGSQSLDCRGTRSCHHTSRPSVIGTSCPVRRSTSTFSIDEHSSTAMSAVSFSGTMAPRRQAPSPVISTFASASLMRSRSDSDEKPPNTTECGGADPRAREECDRQFGHHAEVDVDPVAFADTELLQRVGEAAHVVEKLRIRDGARVARFALPVVRDLVAVPGHHVAIEAVVGRVELPADEPLREREIPLEQRVPLLVPVEELFRLSRPEPLVVHVGFVVDLGVHDERVLLERRRRRERASLGEQGLDRVGHVSPHR